MATFNKINDFVEHLSEGKHNLESDTIAIALSNTAPSSESSDPTADGNGVLANVTEISYANLSSRVVSVSTSAQTSGVYKLVLTDLTLFSSGGSTGPFRYIYIYNDTSLNDELIAYYDYGFSETLEDGEGLILNFDDTNGVLTLT